LYFDIDLKNNTMVLWTDNLGCRGKWYIKAVYNLQSYWTSMAAILASPNDWNSRSRYIWSSLAGSLATE
jgi:hypothetical protein